MLTDLFMHVSLAPEAQCKIIIHPSKQLVGNGTGVKRTEFNIKMKAFGHIRFRKRKNYWLLVLSILFVVCYFTPDILLSNRTETLLAEEWVDSEVIYSETAPDSNETLKNEIIILRYTKYFGHLEPEPVLQAKHCSYLEKNISSLDSSSGRQKSSDIFNIPCRITFDHKYFNDSDALVFHSHDLDLEELPDGGRNPKQIWVYLQQESPLKTALNLQGYPNTFNWTMTYRRDSDVYHPYSHLVQIPTTKKADAKLKLQTNKTGLVAWIVSNCDPPSKRQYFVYELQKFIPVDIFGWCGRECPSENCYNYVASNYKFYLSLENSLCTDYITEKFFRALTLNLVPIVYGGGYGEDYSAIAPEKSYIDARSFNSPKDLANYLLHLDKEDEEYRKYLEWKNKYEILTPAQGQWCNLCQRVYEHLKEDPPRIKWYKDLWKWWHFMGVRDEGDDQSKQQNLVPTCVTPPKKLTNFYHGLFTSGVSGKIAHWAKKRIFKRVKRTFINK